MVQNGPNGSKWTERFQIVPTVTNGSKLPNALKWFQMDPNGSKWIHMVPKGSQ